MFELKKTQEINRLISITKSDSGVSGPELVKAHIALGEALGSEMTCFKPQDTTIVALLRGGIFFAEGMYLSMGCKFSTYDPKNEKFIRPNTKNVIIVDAVINTGKTILDIATDDDIYIACNVINCMAVPLFDNKLFAVRVSNNSFVGSNIVVQDGQRGPDTTMRLFNLL